MKVKKRWVILMTAMTLIALAGIFVGEPTFECDWSVLLPSPAGYVTVGQSIFIAFVITIICNVAVYWRSHSRIDDALDVFPTPATS